MTYIREGLSGAMRGKTEILTFVNHSVMDIRATGEKTIETERLKVPKDGYLCFIMNKSVFALNLASREPQTART